MAISIVQVLPLSESNGPSGATFHAASLGGVNFTAGNTVFYCHSYWFQAPTSLSIAGSAATLDLARQTTSGDLLQIWRLSNVGSGRDDVVLSGDAGGYNCGAILEVSGLDSNPLDQISGPSSGTDNQPTASTSTTTVADELIIALFANGSDGGGSSPPTGYSLLYPSAQEGGSGAYKIVSATGTQSVTFTTPGNIVWVCGIATYKAADTGVSGVTIPTYSSYITV